MASAALGGRPVDSYFELHIEQGPELEEAGITIGVVTHSNYSLYADIEWLGDNAHISSMPMLRRRNALVGAARMIAEIDRIGRARAANGAASATVIDIWPNNRINIPHRATFSYGLIHTDAEGLAQMAAEVEQAAGAVAAETGLEFRMLNNRKRDVVRFDPALTALVEQIATQSGHSVTRMRTKPRARRVQHDAAVPDATDLRALPRWPVAQRVGVVHAPSMWRPVRPCCCGRSWPARHRPGYDTARIGTSRGRRTRW